jgi:thioredoxin-related protein
MAHPAGDPDDLKYAESIGVAENNVVVVRPGLRVRSTPTIVLVNKNGTVLAAWEGAGPPEKQAAIVKEIDAALR